MKCHSTISADIETIICNGNKLRFIFDNAKECEKVKRIVKMDKPVTEEEKKEADSLGISLLYIVEVEVRLITKGQVFIYHGGGRIWVEW